MKNGSASVSKVEGNITTVYINGKSRTLSPGESVIKLF